jgi:hypothetical protein
MVFFYITVNLATGVTVLDMVAHRELCNPVTVNDSESISAFRIIRRNHPYYKSHEFASTWF